MIQKFIDIYIEKKEALAEKFKSKHPENYKEIVFNVINIIADGTLTICPDANNIHEIDDGDYQGTLVFIIPQTGYQPSTYWGVTVSYGSCSGCDILESIRSYHNEKPTEDEVKDYMTLALHIVQQLKLVSGNGDRND